MSIELSVILPVYNAAQHLRETMDCLASQSLDDMEIICVNDGSTDNSLQILYEYQEKYSEKIKVIDSENQGVWFARKLGLNSALGKYIAFCDSDDLVEKSMYEILLNQLKKTHSDMIVCAFDRIDSKTKKIKSKEMTQFDNSIINTKNQEWIFPLINTSLWNKIIKRDILEQTVEFVEPPRVMEDTMFLASIYPKVKRVCFCKEVLYHYIVRDGTAMTYIRDEEVSLLIDNMKETKKYICDKYDETFIPVIDTMAFIHLGISLITKISKEADIDLKKRVYEIRNVVFQDFSQYEYFKISNLGRKNMQYYWKIILSRTVFKTKVFFGMIQIYNFMIEKFNIEIKW